MTGELKFHLTILFLVLVICAYIAYPGDKPLAGEGEILERFRIERGIDLAGGAELIYDILYPPDYPDANKREDAQRIAETIRRRIDSAALKQPRINTMGADRIVIQLPGVHGEQLKKYQSLIEKMGVVKWWILAGHDIVQRVNQGEPIPTGYRRVPVGRADVRDGCRHVVEQDGEKYVLIQVRETEGGRYDTTLFDAREVVSASPTMADMGASHAVSFELKLTPGRRFEDATRWAVQDGADLPDPEETRDNGHIAVSYDEDAQGNPLLITAPVVRSEIPGGKGVITGMANADEAKELVIILASGQLRHRIGSRDQNKAGVPASSRLVGPTLGADAIRRAMWALGIAAGAVAIFMLAYYLGLGITAVAGLTLNVCLIGCTLALFGATVTLPGLAALVLTLGMAVDANILIFERIREETAKGKTLIQAFEQGHSRALSAIVDGNLTTFLAGLVLYFVSSETPDVKGFAVVLMLGIITTMISVLYGSKTLLKALIVGGVIRQAKMMRLLAAPKFPFVKYMVPMAVVSLLLVVGAFFAMGFAGKKALGIDFTGGVILRFHTRQAVSIDDIRRGVLDFKDPATGLPRYPDAEVQTMAAPDAPLVAVGMLERTASTFQVRTMAQAGGTVLGEEDVKQDLYVALEGILSRPPRNPLAIEDIPTDPYAIEIDEFEGRAGCNETGPEHEGHLALSGFWLNLEPREGETAEILRQVVLDEASGLGWITPDSKPLYIVVADSNPPEGTVRLKIVLAKKLVESQEAQANYDRLWEKIRELDDSDRLPVPDEPFDLGYKIGPSVAERLKEDTLLGLIIASVLMVGYIWLRFFGSLRFGIAAVIPLVHDVAISIGMIALAAAFIPESWGLNFDINLPAVAAFLTIVGYSVNDTVIVFDRCRENLLLMKQASLAEIIDTSVNQTLSRTILTSGTTLLTVVVLFAFTMRMGGGVANFAFPMIVGVAVGTYSSIYVASALVLAMYKGKRPEMRK